MRIFKAAWIVNAINVCGAVLWSYTAYIYNWLNVGGGESHYMATWITLSEEVPCAVLSVWLISLCYLGIVGRQHGHTRAHLLRIMLGALMIPVVVFFIADGYFHRNFPKSPDTCNYAEGGACVVTDAPSQ